MDTKLKLTDSQIIDLLGGTAKVSKLCKVSMPAVAQWKLKGMPSDKLMLLAATLEKESHGLITRKDIFPKTWKLIWPELN